MKKKKAAAADCALTCGRFLHLLPLPLLLLPLKIYRGTHKVWLQHSRSLDHSDILLLTAMFTHPLLGIRAANSQPPESTAACNSERERPNWGPNLGVLLCL